MVLTHYSKPKIKIRVDPNGNDDAVEDYLSTGYITRPINAIDIAVLTLTDENNVLFNNTIVYGDDVAIYINYEAVSSPLATTDLRFYGFVEDMSPSLTEGGELLNIRLRHYGRCVNDMRVSQEYGSESVNSTLDEFHEILQDNANGIIDNYVNEINNDGNPSGYSLSDTYIEEDTDSIKYIYFPFKPAINCIHDLQDIYQALQGAATAGWHWIIQTVESPADTFTNYFCLAQVNNHELAGAPAIETVWPTWWNTNEAGSTIVVKQDMMLQAIDYRRALANYVLYYGRLLKPGDGDRWTENNHALWGTGDHTTASTEAGATNFLIGSSSLKLDHDVDATPDNQAYYPSTQDAAWDIDSWGGIHNIPTLDFWMKTSATAGIGNNFNLELHSVAGGGGYLIRWLDPILVAADHWYHIVYPLGSYAPTDDFATGTYEDGWGNSGVGDWGCIDYIKLTIGTSGTGQDVNWYIDGLHFDGWVMRGAKKLKVGGAAEDYYKQHLIVDDVGKDDSGIAATDTYLMAQMAYGELLRAARRPLQGIIALPGKPTILAGQKAHIHACKYSGGYRMDKAMRILEHRLTFTPSGCATYLTVTDDLINGRPMGLVTPRGLVMKAALPAAQNRTSTSIISKSIDITQPILEKTYQFNDYY